jgi:hypothetical protein
MDIIYLPKNPTLGDDWVPLTNRELENLDVGNTIIISKKKGEACWVIENTLWTGAFSLVDCYVSELEEFCKLFVVSKLFTGFDGYKTNMDKFKLRCNLKRIDEED